MPFVKKLNQDFYIKDQHIELSEDYLKNNHFKFKKITATRLSGVLGKNNYASPFKTWCMMVGLFKEEMDPMLSNAGNKIEPKIRDYVSQLTDTKYQCYDPRAVKWDIFPDNKVFGGIPDGEPIDANGQLAYTQGKRLLEIKTSSIDKLAYENVNGSLMMKKDANGFPVVKQIGAKKAEWFNNQGKLVIPTEYLFQVALYSYLRKIEHAYLAVTFLTPNDYKNPEQYEVKDHEVYVAQVDLDLKKISPMIEQAQAWYMKYIADGKTSPKMSQEDYWWIKRELKI